MREIAVCNDIYRFATGIYIASNNKAQINTLIRNTQAVMGAQGIEVLSLAQNPIAQQDFINNLAFAFSYKKDREFYNKRAMLQDLNSIAKISPLVGRSTGTGSACLLKFNRGGERPTSR